MQSKSKVDVLLTYVEIENDMHQPTCSAYKEKGFKDQFGNALRKRNSLKFISGNKNG